jgi:hypothetical protein
MSGFILRRAGISFIVESPKPSRPYVKTPRLNRCGRLALIQVNQTGLHQASKGLIGECLTRIKAAS